MSFWEQPQGAAIFKHAVLQEYAPIFASKVGSASRGNRVDIVDGYAGRGWYEDGSAGSPGRVLETAGKLAARRRVHCWFIEEDRRNFEILEAGLAEAGADLRVTPLLGTMSEHLPRILSETTTFPLFAFIDPFGLGLPFEQVVDGLMARTGWINGRRSGPATEVLMNFVYAGIYRNAGQLNVKTSDPVQAKVAETKVGELDQNLGGTWWHQLVREDLDTDVLVATIRDEYIRRILERAGPGWGCISVPVSDSPKGRPIYELLHFSQHEQGSWFFNDAVSLARQVFHTHFEDNKGFLQHPLWEPEEEWVAAIRSNLEQMLEVDGQIRLLSNVEGVYGSTLGEARGVHAKRAARELVDAGRATGRVDVEPHQIMLQAVSTL